MTGDFKVGVIATVYFPFSHADVIVSRWLEPMPTDVAYGWVPRTRIASLYVAQVPPTDLSNVPEAAVREEGFAEQADMARRMSVRHGVPLYPDVRAALTMGSDRLAVDAVLLIGEHGAYPYNSLGQKLYPRYELFQEIVQVFRESGRSVLVFCDKHLSWNPEWAREMQATADAMGFPLMAGSSIPYYGAEPPLGIAPGSHIEEGVGIFYCGPETYGFHSLEWMQSLVENRAGGEAGIVAVRAYEGDEVWNAQERGEWSQELFAAALSQDPHPHRWQRH